MIVYIVFCSNEYWDAVFSSRESAQKYIIDESNSTGIPEESFSINEAMVKD